MTSQECAPPQISAELFAEVPVIMQAATAEWGSDYIAEILRSLKFEYIALNPGSSFRGLHDSLVNYLGNERPTMLLCLHEEHAVAIAHGWAKVNGRPMAVALHSNVGLMHASMAIYNAWCDRVPMMILGGGGPLDAARRRPWIDWIHTARDQGALVRHFVKWDDQPGSVAAAQEALLRGSLISETAPQAPVYISLDVALQEDRATFNVADVRRFERPKSVAPPADVVAEVAERLGSCERPLILMGRVSRKEDEWARRVELAERFNALVLTDLKQAAAFPSAHLLAAAPAGMFPTPRALEIVRDADVILSLDWVDLGGIITSAWPHRSPTAYVIHASVDQLIHNGWAMDHMSLPPVDLPVLCEPDIFVAALLKVPTEPRSVKWSGRALPTPQADGAKPFLTAAMQRSSITTALLAAVLQEQLTLRDVCLIRTPLSWAGEFWDVTHPLSFLGYDGGGGIGSGPGMTVGAALALRGSGRLPLAVLGDGDFMMGISAIWTAVHYRIPALMVIANNQSFFNDEMHQERVARTRTRPVENRWIGQRIANPALDLCALARAQGACGIGPITSSLELAEAIRDAVIQVDAGNTVILDVRIVAGYHTDFNTAAFKE